MVSLNLLQLSFLRYGHIFEDGGRIVMQIGRPQISFYSILRMANLGSKAREKGQNYKDLGLLPLSLTSNEAHVKLRAKRCLGTAAKQATLAVERAGQWGGWRIHESVRQTIQDALGTVKAKNPKLSS